MKMMKKTISVRFNLSGLYEYFLRMSCKEEEVKDGIDLLQNAGDIIKLKYWLAAVNHSLEKSKALKGFYLTTRIEKTVRRKMIISVLLWFGDFSGEKKPLGELFKIGLKVDI